MIPFEVKDRYTVQDLVRVVQLLRGEGGCPWDRAQTHRTIRANVLEEAYEVADAIDCGSDTALCEETGDLLLQVVFHCVMAQERGAFTFDDAVDGIVKKLVFRHPHVFGDVTASNAEEALDSWDARKRREKHQDTVSETLRSVPKAFPSLLRAQKVYKRAKKASFFSHQPSTDEVKNALDVLENCQTDQQRYDAMGQLLMKTAQLAQEMHIDAEETLERAVDGWVADFEDMESQQHLLQD